METMVQPKITGYRQLGEAEVELMNEGKALAEACWQAGRLPTPRPESQTLKGKRKWEKS